MIPPMARWYGGDIRNVELVHLRQSLPQPIETRGQVYQTQATWITCRCQTYDAWIVIHMATDRCPTSEGEPGQPYPGNNISSLY